MHTTKDLDRFYKDVGYNIKKELTEEIVHLAFVDAQANTNKTKKLFFSMLECIITI
jgi:hypothetical protein